MFLGGFYIVRFLFFTNSTVAVVVVVVMGEGSKVTLVAMGMTTEDLVLVLPTARGVGFLAEVELQGAGLPKRRIGVCDSAHTHGTVSAYLLFI